MDDVNIIKKKTPYCIGKAAGHGRPLLSERTLDRIDQIERAVRRLIGWPADEERITGWIYSRRRRKRDKERTEKI